MNIPTLDGPNWGTSSYSIHLQAAAQILDCWDVIKGETLGTIPHTYNLLPIPTTGAQGLHPNTAQYAAAKTTWTRKTHKPLVPSKAQHHLLYGKTLFHTTKWACCGQSWRIILKSGGSYNLPPIGQYSENLIHWFNRSVASDPRIPGKLYLDNIKWPQQIFWRPHNFHVLFQFTQLLWTYHPAISQQHYEYCKL